MNLSNMSIQELKDAIQKLKAQILQTGEKDSSILIPVLDEYTNEYNARLKTSWNEFTRILLPEYFIYVSKLAQIMREGNSSELIRRAFFCSHYGMVLSEVLDLEQFAELRGFYPKLTLPVIPDSNIDINSLFHEGLPLGLLANKYVKRFEHFRDCRQEDNLRVGIWGPLLTDLINFVSDQGGQNHSIVVNEMYSSPVIKSFPWDRCFDLAAVIRGGGLPILLVEMSKSECPPGQLHKDLKKVATAMAFIFMELVRRAKADCPNFDVNQFKLFGILIGGRIFELCVGSLVEREGKINFIFHHSGTQWKFALFGEDLVTEGGVPNSPSHSEMDIENLLNAETIVEFLMNEDYQSELEADYEDVADLHIPEAGQFASIKSIKILLQFLFSVVSYYENLPECLKQCYWKEPREGSVSKNVFKFPPKGHLPTLKPSASSHGSRSNQSYSPELIAKSLNQSQIDFYRFNGRGYQNLPDVVLLNTFKGEIMLKQYAYGIDDLKRELNQFFRTPIGDPDGEYDVPPTLIFKYSRIHAEMGKFLIDSLMAAHAIHSAGFICGTFERDFFTFDGFFWRISDLPELRSINDDPSHKFQGIREYFHISDMASQRDDLYSIAMTIRRYLSDGIFAHKLSEPSNLVRFQEFLSDNIDKMANHKKYPELNAIQIISDVFPAFVEIAKPLDRFPHLSYTLQAAESLLHEMTKENSQSSIEVDPIKVVEECFKATK